jgi:hypothetical protein
MIMEGEVSNANLNTLLYDMAKKLDQKDYWKQLMSPMEEELIRTKLLSKETWTSFLLLESTSSDSEMDVWIAMRVVSNLASFLLDYLSLHRDLHRICGST